MARDRNNSDGENKQSLFDSFWGGTNRTNESRDMGSFCMRGNATPDEEPMEEQGSTDISVGSVEKLDDDDDDNAKDVENGDGQTEEGDDEHASTVESMEGIDPFGAMVIGTICCWCKPVRTQSFKDWLYRTIYWTGLNKDQMIGGLVGKILPKVLSDYYAFF
jgi:hypothetical protein